jgi:hypothetical protein
MTAGLDSGLEAVVSLTASVDRLCTALARDLANAENVRFIKGAPAYGIVPASGVLLLDLDGPKTGYVWTVRRVNVTDGNSFANTMGSAVAQIYAGQMSATLVSQILPQNVEWAFSTLPNVANFSSDQLVLQYGEHLQVLVTGGTAGETVQASVAYQLYRPDSWARAEVQI